MQNLMRIVRKHEKGELSKDQALVLIKGGFGVSDSEAMTLLNAAEDVKFALQSKEQKFFELINKYGFPIIAAGGMGYLIYYVWEWATKEIKPVLGEANTTLIALIDRIRMLDNDLIRLNQKLRTVLMLREQQEQHTHKK